MTARGALVIAILVECLVLLANWYLRIRGYPAFFRLAVLHLPALAFYLWVFLRYFQEPRAGRRPMPRDPWLALIVIASIAVVLLGGFQEKGDWTYLLGFLLRIAAVVPKEELFYRGILQSSLERAMHPVAAILLANVAFIASHAAVMDINALSISIIGATGIVLGVIYHVTRSMALVTVLHVIGDWALIVPTPTMLGNDAVIAANALVCIAAFWWWFSRRERLSGSHVDVLTSKR